jgi:hypothetical protein
MLLSLLIIMSFIADPSMPIVSSATHACDRSGQPQAVAALNCRAAHKCRRVSQLLSLYGGSSQGADTFEEEARLQKDYERYKAAVEMPLSNFDEATAQRTQAVRVKGLLSQADIDGIHRLGQAIQCERADATIDRSAWGQPSGTWLVTFLNTAGAFESMLPELHSRIRDTALAVDQAYWNVTEGILDVNYRVVEYHTMHSSLDGQPTGGGLHTKRHCDQGSLITIDILLTDPSEIVGGVLQTLEVNEQLLNHTWERGDALIFLSHKYHCVSKLTRGTRQVLVSELWQGTENQAPSRDEQLRWQGTWKRK